MPQARVSAFVLIAAAGFAAAQTSGPLRPIALTGTDGQYGPGLGAGVAFESLSLATGLGAPSMANSGAVAFGATLTGAGIAPTNRHGAWAWRGGSGLSLVARAGEQLGDQPAGVVFDEFYAVPHIADNNAVAFQASLRGPGVDDFTDDGLFSERNGSLMTVLREGVTAAPSYSPPAFFGSALGGTDPWIGNRVRLGRGGDSAIRVHVNSPPNPFGIFTDASGTLTAHAIRDSTWTDGTETYAIGGMTEPRINESGAILASWLVSDPPFSGDAVFSSRARNQIGQGIEGVGDLHPVAVSGDPAPGTGSTFGTLLSNRFPSNSINKNGRVMFPGQLAPPGPGAAGGLWSDARFGVLQLVALSGSAAPGTNGAEFQTVSEFMLGAVLSDSNIIAMNAQLNPSGLVGGGNDTGLWTTRVVSTGSPGPLRLLVREGSPVPASAGPVYSGLSFGEISAFWINAQGLVAFVTQHNDFTRALWVENIDGSLSPVVKEFTLLDLFGDGTDVRLVSEIDFTPFASTGDGRRHSLNDDGDIALRIEFSDTSQGVFTTSLGVDCGAPIVTTPPMDQSIQPGGSFTLCVESEGTGPRAHQWRFEGAPIPGEIGTSLTVDSAGFDDEGLYDCVITNACGTVTTDTVFVSVGIACPGDIADDFGTLGDDGMVSFGDFLALLGLVGPCPVDPGCAGDIADDFGSLGSDGMVSFGDLLALLGLVGPCP